MSSRKSTPDIQQTAIGNDNIQVVGSHNVITRITNLFAGDTEQKRAMRNRRAMLELVKNTWIKGVLEKSLYKEVLIQLSMEERPGAVDHPWDAQVQMPDKERRTLPAGASMMEIFDEMNDAMLILGEPGSGKTTMLLELARDCIERAKQDDNQPIPIVFNLSSWDGKQTIDEWFANEMRTKYNVPKKIAESWVKNDELSLFLDGLDEINHENRDACVETINNFHQEHGLTTPIAICSRVADYEALNTKLNLAGAILLRSLTPKQIEGYFTQVGPKLAGVHQTLKNDEILMEMAKLPLVTSILIQAYQDNPAESIENESLDTIEKRRKHLFNTYIEKMFERVARTRNEKYPKEKVIHWLGWLASNMIAYNQVLYLIENMQPWWLNEMNRKFYMILAGLISGISGGLMFGSGIGLIGWSIGGHNFGKEFGLSGFLIGSILGGFLFGLIVAAMSNFREIKMIDLLIWNLRKGIEGLGIGLFRGVIFGASLGIVTLIFDSRYKGHYEIIAVCVMVSGALGGLMRGLFDGLSEKPISQTSYPGQKVISAMNNYFVIFLAT